MKKGFTLIELLAVIVILAIIALIATPLILNVIDDSKRGAFKSTAYGIIQAAELNYAQNVLNGVKEEKSYVYENGEQVSSQDTILEFKGNKPKSGQVRVKKDGKIAVALYNGKYCVEKDYNDSEVILSEKPEEECIIPFECGQDLIDSRDSNIYKTVLIGEQCWMAENLKYTGNGCLSKAWDGVTPHDACISHSTDWGEEVLYQWKAAMNESTTPGAQGLCPDRWHIPSNEEWKILEGTVDSTYKVGNAVWDNFSWRGSDVGTKLKGEPFNGMLSGYRSGNTGFFGSVGKWWTSTPLPDSMAVTRTMISSNSNTGCGGDYQSYGASVRCVYGPGL